MANLCVINSLWKTEISGAALPTCHVPCMSSHKICNIIFMVTPCINNAESFYYQLMHIMLKNTELLKHSKIEYTFTQCMIHTPYRSQYAAIALTTPCTSFTQILLTKCVIFSQALNLAPWRWFLCKPKHVGAFLFILECFNNSVFFNIMCISW